MSDNSSSENSALSVQDAKRAIGKMVSTSETYYHKTPESIFAMLGTIYPTGAYKECTGTHWFCVIAGTVEITWFKV